MLFADMPIDCFERVLKYVYEGALNDIEMNWYVDSVRDGWFQEELALSNVPANLRGRVLENGSVLLCSRQLPLVDRVQCASNNFGIAPNMGIAQETLDRWLFREFRGQLQARSFRVMDLEDYWRILDLEHYWQGPWMTIGKVLKNPYPLAALSNRWYRWLCTVAPCNYKYVLPSHQTIGVPDVELVVCARGEAPL